MALQTDGEVDGADSQETIFLPLALQMNLVWSRPLHRRRQILRLSLYPKHLQPPPPALQLTNRHRRLQQNLPLDPTATLSLAVLGEAVGSHQTHHSEEEEGASIEDVVVLADSVAGDVDHSLPQGCQPKVQPILDCYHRRILV